MIISIIVISTSIFIQVKYAKNIKEYFNGDDYKAVPSSFYDQSLGHVESGFPMIEYSTDFVNKIMKEAGPLDEQSNDSYLLNILNIVASKDCNEPLFKMAESEIISKTNNITISKHLVNRTNKIYGIELEITTETKNKQTRLIDYKIIGFVFDDKIKMNEPANIVLADYSYQPFMKDKTFMKDSNYENQYLCDYYENLRKYGKVIAQPPEGLKC